MKKILIAIDYNPTAEKVTTAGYALAKAMRAEITIIHVITDASYYALEYSPFMGYQGYSADTIALARNIKKEAEHFLAAFVDHLGNENIKTRVLEGDTTDSILKYSEEWGASLIVMGSHSHRGLDRLLVTDVASQVLKHSKIPLFIIPTKDK